MTRFDHTQDSISKSCGVSDERLEDMLVGIYETGAELGREKASASMVVELITLTAERMKLTPVEIAVLGVLLGSAHDSHTRLADNDEILF